MDQRLVAGAFLVTSAVVFGVAVGPHFGARADEPEDTETIFASENAFSQLIAANIALGLCAATISVTADMLVAFQEGRDPMQELQGW